MEQKKRRLRIDKRAFNAVYVPYLNCFNPLQIYYGGAGSGKSEFIARKLLIHVINIPKFNLLVTRKVGDTLRTSCFNLFEKILYEWRCSAWFKINRTSMTIEHIATGNTIVFKGMDDREKIKSITFKNGDLHAVWIEEASEFEEEDFVQLDLRLRGQSEKQKFIILSFNPIDINHWINVTIFNVPERRDKAVILKTTYKDNRFVGRGYHQKMEILKDTNPYYYQVYALGEWGILNVNNVIVPVIAVLKARNNNFASCQGGYEVGVDVARFGDDSTVIYMRQGLKIIAKKSLKGARTTEVTRAVIAIIREKRTNDSDIVRVKIDETGIGSGVVDQLIDYDIQNIEVFGVNNSSKAKDSKKYANTGTEMYFELAKILGDCDIPNDTELSAELSQRRYLINAKSQFQIEAKELFKKRIGKSPDKGDALCLCFYTPREMGCSENLELW